MPGLDSGVTLEDMIKLLIKGADDPLIPRLLIIA